MLKQIVIAALCAGSIGTLAAQEPAAKRQGAQAPAADAPPAASDPDALSAAQLAAALDAYALMQAQQQLSISDAKSDVFAARLKRLQDIKRRNQRMRLRLIQDLRRIAGPRANPPGDEAAITAALKSLRDHDERAAAELRQAYEALDQVLDVRQQARFRLFEEVIEQRKLELLVRAQQRAREARRPPG